MMTDMFQPNIADDPRLQPALDAVLEVVRKNEESCVKDGFDVRVYSYDLHTGFRVSEISFIKKTPEATLGSSWLRVEPDASRVIFWFEEAVLSYGTECYDWAIECLIAAMKA